MSVLWQNTKINSVMHKKYSVKINTENESESVWAQQLNFDPFRHRISNSLLVRASALELGGS